VVSIRFEVPAKPAYVMHKISKRRSRIVYDIRVNDVTVGIIWTWTKPGTFSEVEYVVWWKLSPKPVHVQDMRFDFSCSNIHIAKRRASQHIRATIESALALADFPRKG
jgi:hypothetical protein